jgi:ribokinase
VVVVIGDVMVDIVVRPVGPFNKGSDTTSKIVVAPGGSATNQAVAFAAAGTEVHLVAVVGDDELGHAATRALAATGVYAHLEVLQGQRTGVVVALVDALGERSMLTDRGANRCLEKRHLSRGHLAKGVPRSRALGEGEQGKGALGQGALEAGLFGRGRHLHLSGYELLDEATRPAGLAALELSAAAGMSRSVDPSSAGPLASVGASAFLDWTDGLDWCCANLEEGRILTGKQRPEEVLVGLRRHYREVTLTLGAGGVMFSGPGTELLHCPADRVAVEDTTGAGDAFTGTFLARRLQDEAPAAALRSGLAAASRVVTAAGARSWR